MAGIGYIIEVAGSPGGRAKEDPLRIVVERIEVPQGDLMGYGIGTTDDGTVEVIFWGPAPMMSFMKGIVEDPDTETVIAEVPEGAVIAAREKRAR
jgi:hypothetical protein